LSKPTLVLLVSLVLSSIGCRAKPPTQPLTLDRRVASGRVVRRLAGIDALRAEVGLRFSRGEESRSTSGALVVQRPDRIRLRCWGPLGVTVLDLLVRDRRATLYMPRDNAAFRVALDRVSEEEALEPGTRSLLLVESLLAELETADLPFRVEPDPDARRGSLVVLRDDVPIARVIYDRATLLPEARISLVGPPCEIRYEGYRPMGERWWPRRLTVISGDLRLAVQLRDVEVNPEIDPAVFEMALPTGTRLEGP
jgi:outer membrane lipoprotein-sorting protein